MFVHPDCRRRDQAAVLHAWLKMQVEMTRMPMIPRHHGAVAPGGEMPIDRRRFSKVGEFFIHTPPFYQCQADLSALAVAASSI